MALTFGKVLHPAFVDRLIPDAQNRAWDDLGTRKPVSVGHQLAGQVTAMAIRITTDDDPVALAAD